MNELDLSTIEPLKYSNLSSMIPHNSISFRNSEYALAHTILLHEPSDELYLGMLHPQAALFEKYFSIEKAQQEHRNYVQLINKHDINTVLVRDILLHGCVDTQGETMEGEAMQQLRNFAFEVLNYDCTSFSDEEKEAQAAYKKESIAALNAQELVNMILLQPTVKLSEVEHNTKIEATYEYKPLLNLFYTRDQSIVTPNGVVICHLNSSQRKRESELIKFCYQKLGITPIHEVAGEGAFLEGGDYLVSESHSFIGCGMRTTQKAIDQLMEADAFGTEHVVVVKDKRLYQPEMHLDTYFNIIDKDLVTLGEERMLAPKNDSKYVSVDVYSKGIDGKYALSQQEVGFVEFLNALGMQIIPITPEDQERLGNNFLTVAPRTILAVEGQSDSLKTALTEHGVAVTWVPLDNLTKGYGAAHCMTQVIFSKTS